MKNPFRRRYRSMGERINDYALRTLIVIIVLNVIMPTGALPGHEQLGNLYTVVWGVIAVVIGTLIAIPLSYAISWSIRRSERSEYSQGY